MNNRKCRNTIIKMFVIFLLIYFVCFFIQGLYKGKENNDAVEVSINKLGIMKKMKIEVQI